MVEFWVAMAGPAGAGKSTLSECLGAAKRREGAVVDVCAEVELFTRGEFAEVADAFRTTDGPAPAVLESAYAAWLDGLPDGAAVVTDWNPAGMAGDLPWARADQGRFRAHLEEVARLTAGRIIVLDLRVPVEVAVRRAARQRGEDWLVRLDGVARAAGHDEPDRLQRIIAWSREHTYRTAVELQVASSAGWSVHRVDAAAAADTVHQHVSAFIAGRPHGT